MGNLEQFCLKKKFVSSAIPIFLKKKYIALVSMKLDTLSEICLIWFGYLSHECWNK